MRLGIVGGGRAAWAYGSAWNRIGWPLAGVWLRDESGSHIAELLQTARLDLADLARDSELLLVAVSDSAIAEVVESVPETESLIFHASGALPSMRGGFSLHPLRTLPPVGEPCDLRDTLLVFEGEHRRTARLIAAAIGARFEIVERDHKALYHAAAVFGSNYVAAVLEISERLMERAGVGHVREDLVALARSALDNWLSSPGSRRFTGPAARGDHEVLRRHLAALSGDEKLTEIYRFLADEIAGAVVARPE